MIGGLVLVLLAAALGLIATWPRITWHLRARGLHRRLARASDLDHDESGWLWRWARRVSPERPELVFVRPSLLQSGGVGGESPMAAAVRDKLFRP